MSKVVVAHPRKWPPPGVTFGGIVNGRKASIIECDERRDERLAGMRKVGNVDGHWDDWIDDLGDHDDDNEGE